jgi:hypothetical protein
MWLRFIWLNPLSQSAEDTGSTCSNLIKGFKCSPTSAPLLCLNTPNSTITNAASKLSQWKLLLKSATKLSPKRLSSMGQQTVYSGLNKMQPAKIMFRKKAVQYCLSMTEKIGTLFCRLMLWHHPLWWPPFYHLHLNFCQICLALATGHAGSHFWFDNFSKPALYVTLCRVQTYVIAWLRLAVCGL